MPFHIHKYFWAFPAPGHGPGYPLYLHAFFGKPVFNTKLISRGHIRCKVAFLFYNAVMLLHSRATEKLNKEIKRKMNEYIHDILRLFWYNITEVLKKRVEDAAAIPNANKFVLEHSFSDKNTYISAENTLKINNL